MSNKNLSNLISVLIPVVIVGILFGFIVYKDSNKPTEPVAKEPEKIIGGVNVPDLKIDVNKNYIALLKTTKGDIKIQLDVKNTPMTSNNFVFLAQKGFYDNTIFHRVIKGFMIQGGDPKGNGSGGPGYKFDDEKIVGEYTRGTVAMANSGPNTNGSQFFIMHKDYNLPKNYVIFGKVIEGINVVDAIAEQEVTYNDYGENSQPVEPVKVESVTIESK